MDKEKFAKILSRTKQAFTEVTNELVFQEFSLVENALIQSTERLAIVIGIAGKSKAY